MQTQGNTEEAQREVLRARNQVRLVSDAEDGAGIHRLPNGVYGFTYSVGQEDAPLFQARRLNEFEMHKLPDGTVALVGFVTQDEAAKIESSKDAVDLIIWPRPGGNATTPVSVPIWRLLKTKGHVASPEGTGFRIHVMGVGVPH